VLLIVGTTLKWISYTEVYIDDTTYTNTISIFYILVGIGCLGICDMLTKNSTCSCIEKNIKNCTCYHKTNYVYFYQASTQRWLKSIKTLYHPICLLTESLKALFCFCSPQFIFCIVDCTNQIKFLRMCTTHTTH